MGRNSERRECGGESKSCCSRSKRQVGESALDRKKKTKTKTKQKELCKFSKDGFHHQTLALDENFSTWQSHC